MAKSKSGGTRSMIRGRVGSDVYSIGKNALGKKQQIVRSLAETVANPQTIAQMRGRMIMSTVMQAQSALKPIIDHSFDNVVGVQPNLSEFIKRNYALVKADVAANPSSSNAFGLNAYQEKGAKQGAYVISDGKAAVPAAVTLTKSSGIMVIALTAGTMTMAGLKAALSFGAEDYITLVGIDTNGAAEYVRLHINQALSDETAISASNIASVFELGGNVTPTIAVDGNDIKVTLAAVANCCAFIVTRKQNDGFIHSKATLGAGTGLSWNADAALPTYPIGENKFLNGGDQSFNPAPTPTPSVSAPVISGTSPFETSTSVTMSAESGAEIRYTTDGTNPTSASALYSSAITLTDTTTIKAIAIKDGVSSSVASATFTKSSQPVSGRTITVNGSTVAEGGTVNLETATELSVVVTLPENDPIISKRVMYKTQTGSGAPINETYYAQGENTFTVPAGYYKNSASTGIGYGEDGFPQPEWTAALFTVALADTSNVGSGGFETGD